MRITLDLDPMVVGTLPPDLREQVLDAGVKAMGREKARLSRERLMLEQREALLAQSEQQFRDWNTLLVHECRVQEGVMELVPMAPRAEAKRRARGWDSVQT